MWRKHQQECIDICDEIRSGEPINRVYIDAHPGSAARHADHLISHGGMGDLTGAERVGIVGTSGLRRIVMSDFWQELRRIRK